MIRNTENRAGTRGGQAILFILMVLMILAFVLLGGFDLHKILHTRSRTQNAGDAAALAAARWQGISLNVMGDLNLMQAVALAVGDVATVSAITNMQVRLAFTGPMIALVAAQQAAKQNGIHVDPEFTGFLEEHARRVREDYPSATSDGGDPLFPEPWPGAWAEYADMLSLVAAQGVACAPENMRIYSDPGEAAHPLLQEAFYQAIAGRQWCWFFLNQPALLTAYQNFFPCWWPALPPIPEPAVYNSEIFGLGITLRGGTLDAFLDPAALTAFAEARGLPPPPTNVMTAASTWVCYDDALWHAWDAFAADAGFPAAGPVRPEYNYAGADAATRTAAIIDRITPGAGGAKQESTAVWTAAAKPFGHFEETMDPPHVYGLVLPAFHDVRLIPLDTSSAPAGGGYNLGWRRHVELHLEPYLAGGTAALAAGCWYCSQLVTWEDTAFRQAGVAWLEVNSYRCEIQSGGGGGGPGGGSRRGH